MTNDKLQVNMLGGLKITYKGRTITDNSNRSKKMWNLLAYIITYRANPILQSEFIDNIWPDDESRNPVSALKTSLCRIRNLLDDIAQEDEKFILSARGSYQWNPEYECEVDVQTFADDCKEASNEELNVYDRIRLYKSALDVYKGDFLPKLSAEMWVIPLTAHYHSMYLESAKSLIELLEKKKMYDDMVKYCIEALQIEPYDEKLHCQLVRAFMKQGNNTAALEHHKKATEILYNNLGVQPSKELRQLYLEIIKTKQELETNLDIIIDNLKEADYKKGAFVCDYGIFQETYRIVARQASRNGRSIYVALVTVSDSKGQIPKLDSLNKDMTKLLLSIKNCLRRGDIVSKYSGAQYVIMLPDVNLEDGEKVMKRIVNSYYKNNRKSLLKLDFKLRKVETMDKNIFFSKGQYNRRKTIDVTNDEK